MYYLPNYVIEKKGQRFECHLGVEAKSFMNNIVSATIFAPSDDPMWEVMHTVTLEEKDGEWKFSKDMPEDIQQLQPELNAYLKEMRA